ncbi:MAG: hypothetical protein ACPGU1_21025 [Myxococcota bacterium]
MSLGVRFQETMRGQLVPRDGAAPSTMTVNAHVQAPSVFGMWRGEPMSLYGNVAIVERLEATPASGTITVDLLGCHRIVYELSWRGDDGRLGRFYGWKSLGFNHLVQRWTNLEGQVIEGGALLGDAQLRFALSSLPAFLASIRPV